MGIVTGGPWAGGEGGNGRVSGENGPQGRVFSVYLTRFPFEGAMKKIERKKRK